VITSRAASQLNSLLKTARNRLAITGRSSAICSTSSITSRRRMSCTLRPRQAGNASRYSNCSVFFAVDVRVLRRAWSAMKSATQRSMLSSHVGMAAAILAARRGLGSIPSSSRASAVAAAWRAAANVVPFAKVSLAGLPSAGRR
jgi:hypothetical protein